MHDADAPLPPPFMWACPDCARLLEDLAAVSAMAREQDLCEGVVRGQLMLAGHLANAHPEDVPAPHSDCDRCAFYREHTDAQGMDVLWAEHRVRELFLPPGTARLI